MAAKNPESAAPQAVGALRRQQVIITAGFATVLALGIALVMQGIGVSLEDRSASQVRQASQQVAEDLAAYLREQRHQVEQAVQSEPVQAAVATSDPVTRARARRHLKNRLPHLAHAEFYRWDLPELVQADLKSFGYGKANLLALARDQAGAAPVQAMRDAEGRYHMVWVQAVRQDDQVAGYSYLQINADEVFDRFRSRQLLGGSLAIEQGKSGMVLASVSGRYGIAEGQGVALPIPQSILSVTGQPAVFFRLGEFLPIIDYRSPLALFAGALALFLLTAWFAFLHYRRAVGIEEMLRPFNQIAQKLQRKPGGAEDFIMPVQLRPTPSAVAAVEGQPTTGKPQAAGGAQGKTLDRGIFRAYDIRGVVDQTLNAETARLIGQAVGSLVRERGLQEVVVARDGRLSGPQLSAELIRGLRASGCNVIDIGAVPTPVLYFATDHLNTGSGVMVTGSHNPAEYNGFKIVVGGETLAEDAIADLYARIAEGRFVQGSGGLQSMNVLADYHERIVSDIQAERPLKVVVDCGNGIAGLIAPQVLEGVGCEVIPLYCEVDGQFPNHHPDPSDPHNLQDLILSVKRLNADLGMAFDGDGDRLGVVTAQGEIIYPDRLLMLFAMDVLGRNPGAAIIYDVKCTGHLQDVILRHGGSPIMWKTGHSLIKAKMREENAELAGEMSGHFFFHERWFGFDDGVYAAARLAEILGTSERTVQEIFDELPKGVSTPELKVPMEEGAHYAFIEKFRARAEFPGARVSQIDGVRADYADGWGLVRCSNTTPNLVLRFDADSSVALTRIQNVFRAQLLAVDPALALPF